MENQENKTQEQNVNQNAADNQPETKENFFRRIWNSPRTKKVLKGIGNAAGGIALFVVGAILGKTYEEKHPDTEKLTDGTIDDTESSVE